MVESSTTLSALKDQLINPADIFTLLFLVGGNVVQTALAQNAGFRTCELPLWGTPKVKDWKPDDPRARWRWSVRFSPPIFCFTPVVFSFGWISYAFTTLATFAGGETLMLTSTAQCIVMEGSSGHTRTNTSWVIGRLWRDYAFWMDPSIDILLQELRRDKTRSSWEQAGLITSVYRFKKLDGPRPSSPKGSEWRLSLCITLGQLALAAIPFALPGREWGTLLVTVAGTLLAWWTASLPQWQEEKYRARKIQKVKNGVLPSVVLTSGNGAQHAILIVCEEGSLNLEDLSTGQNGYRPTVTQGIPLILLTVCWTMLLLVAIGVPSNRWWLIGVGGIGMLQNTWVASSPRRPSEIGLQFEFVGAAGSAEVACALAQLERSELGKGVGKQMVTLFFPAGLKTDHPELKGAPGVFNEVESDGQTGCSRCISDGRRAQELKIELKLAT